MKSKSSKSLCGHLASADASIVQSQSVQLLQARICLVVQRGLLRVHVAEFFLKTGQTVVICLLRLGQLLGSVCLRLGGLGRAHALHGLRAGARALALADGVLLLLALSADHRRPFGRGSFFGSGVVVDAAHVVVEIPPPGEAVAGNGPLAGDEEAEVGILAVAVHPVGFSLVAEEAGIGGEVDVDALGDFAVVGLEMGVEIFTADVR